MEIAEYLGPCVSATVERVFSTMISLTVVTTKVEDLNTIAEDHLPEVTGSVSFAGGMTGVVYLSIHPGLSKEMANRITGQDGGHSESEENDVIGEFTNMVTGNIKTAMADKGYNSALTIPSVVRGKSITLSGKGFTHALRVTFSIPEIKEEFQVRLMVKLG